MKALRFGFGRQHPNLLAPCHVRWFSPQTVFTYRQAQELGGHARVVVQDHDMGDLRPISSSDFGWNPSVDFWPHAAWISSPACIENSCGVRLPWDEWGLFRL